MQTKICVTGVAWYGKNIRRGKYYITGSMYATSADSLGEARIAYFFVLLFPRHLRTTGENSYTLGKLTRQRMEGIGHW